MIEAERDPFVVAREVRANAALVSVCISARAAKDHRHYARLGPGGVRLRTRHRHSYAKVGGPRGAIRGFSQASRMRLLDRWRETSWPQSVLVFITLTYPRYFSADPAEWKADLRAWRAAFERRWGRATGVWVMEFQKRGAPHFHLALVLPRGTSIDAVRSWNAQAWYRIAGHGDERHLRQHSKPDHAKRARNPRELLGYLTKELSKARQKELPDWLQTQLKGAGRWWGVWNLDRVYNFEGTTEAEYHYARRVARRIKGGTRPLIVNGDIVLDGIPRQQRRGPFSAKRWQGIALSDRGRRPWTLSLAFLSLFSYLRGAEDPQQSFLRWDRRAVYRAPLWDGPTFAALVADRRSPRRSPRGPA